MIGFNQNSENLVLLRNILQAASNIVAKFSNLDETFNSKKCAGGYLAVFETLKSEQKEGVVKVLPLFVVAIGTFPNEEGEEYAKFAVEKGQRVIETQKLTSYETRNEAENKYGGAIRTENYVLSFSGLSPDTADEAVVLAIAYQVDLLSMGAVLKTASTIESVRIFSELYQKE
jgi:hypothetical protein